MTRRTKLWLSALAGKRNVEIVVAPTDFRRQSMRIPDDAPQWLPLLYNQINQELDRFPAGA